MRLIELEDADYDPPKLVAVNPAQIRKVYQRRRTVRSGFLWRHATQVLETVVLLTGGDWIVVAGPRGPVIEAITRTDL